MPEYFKFCPKCGRVLNRDWCTYCEPEKEEAYRREQMKKYQIEGDYMSDKGIGRDVHGLFGSVGSGISHVFQKQDKEETYEYSYRDQEEFEKEEKSKNGEGVKKSKIAVLGAILAFIIGILPSLIGLLDLSSIDLSSFVPSRVESVIDEIFEDDYSTDSTVLETTYSDYTEDISGDYAVYDSEYHFCTEDGYVDDYDVSWTSGDDYYAYVSEYRIYDDTDQQASKGIAQTLNGLYKTFEQTADAYKKQKLKMDYNVIPYVTYRDDQYANLIINENLNNEQGYDINTNYSYFINMNTLDIIDLATKLDLNAGDYADSIVETIKDYDSTVTNEIVNTALDDKTYYYCVDSEGNVYIAVPYDGTYYNVKLQQDDEDVNINNYL